MRRRFEESPHTLGSNARRLGQAQPQAWPQRVEDKTPPFRQPPQASRKVCSPHRAARKKYEAKSLDFFISIHSHVGMNLPRSPKVRLTPSAERHAPAFTLIELLTVIAIIGILAAILIPTVGKVRDMARATQCSSNMRQIGMAVMAYANDNKNATPSGIGAGGLVNGQPRSWYLQIGPYFGADYSSVDKTRNALRILTCPASVRSLSGELDVPWNGFNDAHWPFISDFGFNFAVNNPNYQGGRVILTRFDQPRNPANTPLLAEMVYQNNFVAATFSAARPASDQAAFEAGQNQRFTQRHGGGGNVLFFDAHVERLSYNALAERSTRGGITAIQFVEGL